LPNSNTPLLFVLRLPAVPSDDLELGVFFKKKSRESVVFPEKDNLLRLVDPSRQLTSTRVLKEIAHVNNSNVNREKYTFSNTVVPL
jgi:hypothetical protein